MSRVRVLVVAAVLGVVAGLLTAYVVPRGDAPNPGADDPLTLHVPLVDQKTCTGASILVIGFGEGRAPLAAAVADNPTGRARYLRTGDSCPAVYGREGYPAPTYVAYLGPYDTLGEACADRMSVEHRSDHVTRLRAGGTIHVQCVCELPAETFPRLATGAAASESDQLWTRLLQTTLDDIDRNPGHHITGAYDHETVGLVRAFQSFRDIAATGVMDLVTWQALRNRACPEYDY